MGIKYSKVRFTSNKNGNTASLILTNRQQESMTCSELSKLFPASEALKMERIQRGPYFDKWKDAFKHDIHGDLTAVPGS